MARTLAYVYGTALAPGVSKNRRLYTKELIEDAVRRAQPRVAAGELVSLDLDKVKESGQPLTSMTHHGAERDSEKIVGRIDELTYHPDSGAVKYKLAVPDTPAGRTMVDLADTSDGQPPFLRGMSIRGAWLGRVRKVRTDDGGVAETADGLDLDGLDFERKPGIASALIDRVERVADGVPTESATDRTPIFESAPEASVTFTESADGVELDEKAPTTKQRDANVGGPYADPGYQPDGKRRYSLSTADRVRAAWSYINQADNAKLYTAAQLARIKSRIKAAAKKFGIKIKEGWMISPAEQITESALTEYADDAAVSTAGSFSIELSNGPVRLCISSYCVDPADLEVIGIAAMSGAVTALKALDPDLDADIDVPGADDTDMDTGESAPGADVTENDMTVAAPGTDAAPTEQEPDVSEPTPAAVTPAAPTATPDAAPPTAPAPAAEPMLSLTQIKNLFASFAQVMPAAQAAPAPQLVGAGAPTEGTSAPAAPVAEAAPTTPPAPPPAPVTESQEQHDQRIAQAAIREYAATLAESGQLGRKGLIVNTATSGVREAADGSVLPPGVPDKPFHELTAQEWRRVRNQVGAEAAGVELPQE